MSVEFPDNFSAEANRLYTALMRDTYRFHGFSGTRADLAVVLARAHNTVTRTEQRITNRQFLGLEVDSRDILDALYDSRGYESAEGWGYWTGRHEGTWWKDRPPQSRTATERERVVTFDDNAMWHAPTRVGNGYDFQRVVFNGGERSGFNQSKSGVQYVWGWDPKADSPSIRIHAGVTFDVGSNFHAIVWITPGEAFLEIVGNGKRTSAGTTGHGQWTVS